MAQLLKFFCAVVAFDAMFGYAFYRVCNNLQSSLPASVFKPLAAWVAPIAICVLGCAIANVIFYKSIFNK